MYKVLVADDARVMRFATLRILKKLGLDAVEAEDGLQALELFEREKPDLVLIDVQMPGLDGLEVVRRIRSLSGAHWVPVIFLTSMEDDADLTRGIEAGGDDYLTKPVSPVVLEAKIRAMRRLDDMRRELMAVTLELRETNERLARLSQLDGLTGLANRRRFDLDLMRELGRARREGAPSRSCWPTWTTSRPSTTPTATPPATTACAGSPARCARSAAGRSTWRRATAARSSR